MSTTDDDVVRWLSKTVAAATALAAEWRRQGLHVGFGSPPVCVTCEQPWPCIDGDPGIDPPCLKDG